MNVVVQLLLWVCRILVGGLFIFSGIVKANDPLGFSYKLEEYFLEFGTIFTNSGWGWLTPVMDLMSYISLSLSMGIVVLEIVLGILTLLGTKMKQVSVWLLSLIVFFTFLTFASWKWGLVKSCGCFGDFIPLTPWESFLKDLVLLVLILPIFIFRKNITSILTPIGDKLAIYISSIVFFLFTFYAYNHLPYADHRPYAVGNSILDKMETQKGNPLILYKLKNKANGAVVEMAKYPDDYERWEPYIDPNDSSAKYFRNVDGLLDVKIIKMKTGQENTVLEIPAEFKDEWKVLKDTSINYFPDIDPKIYDLTAESLEDDFEDKINEMLNDTNYRIVLIIRDLGFFGEFTQANDGWHMEKNTDREEVYKKFQKLYFDMSEQFSVKLTVLTSESDLDKINAFKQEYKTSVKFYYCDDKELKTAIRSSPGLFLWKKDTVKGKWHYSDFPTFEEINENYLN